MRARDFVFAHGSKSSGDLPEDLKERSVRRVRLFAWIVLVVVAVEAPVDHVAEALSNPAYPLPAHVWDLIGVGFMLALCASALALTRATRFEVGHRMWIGAGFLVGLAFALAFTDAADGYWIDARGEPHVLHGIPALSSLILVFPVVVPMTWRRAAIVALAMAAMGPLALLIDAAALGLPTPHPQALVQSAALLTVPIAAALAHIVHQLGLDVKRARELGSYTLEEKLGEGGMGEVWRARHRFLSRPAAVKLIRGTADETRLERFEREAESTSQLKSPHTVEVYDFGVSQAGEIYYVMELLDGVDLEQLIADEGAQPAPRVVDWLRQACHSLREAHEAGIVHRDIKPANLVVCRYGIDDDFLKVLDFGLAVWRREVDAADARITGDNIILGTPAYMPPEVATGKSEADARSDLYALGCVAYVALTGRPVFAGDSPVEVILGHVDRAPVPPREIAGVEVPEALERAVLRCLEKSPADRPQSAAELAAALDGLPGWPAAEARAWWDARRS